MGIKFGKIENNPRISEKDYEPAIRMGIDNAPASLIVKYITDMYSYPLESAIRETISNAIDAANRNGFDVDGIEAGTMRFPFDDCRTDRSAFFVSDRGQGMTADTLINVYTQYGVSDKREDNSSIGAFGLGAKSPLTYATDMFIETKTEEDGCLFEVAYRTPNDDFIASVPIKVNDSTKITIIRDRMTKRIISVNEFRDYPEQDDPDDGTIRIDIAVKDVFDENETGTIVLFPLSTYSDKKKAENIIRSIDTLLWGADGKCSHKANENKFTMSEKEKWYCLGTENVMDSSGTEIEMSVYFNSNSSRSIDYLIDMSNDINTASEKQIGDFGFKVGCWYYPSDGSSWKASDDGNMIVHQSIIVEVPSTALSFLPSRDTIRTGGSNDNIRFFWNEAKRITRDAVNDPERLADIVNWSTRVAKRSPLATMSMCFTYGDYMCKNGFDGEVLHVKRPYRSNNDIPSNEDIEIGLDLGKVDVYGKYTIAELLNTDPLLFGTVKKDRYGDVKFGNLYACSDTITGELGDLVASEIDLKSDHSERSFECPSYATARKKTIADDFTSFAKPAELAQKIEMSHKDDDDKANMIRRYNVSDITFRFPYGIATLALPGSNCDRFCIIDASKTGVRQIRLRIAEFFDNEKDGLFAIIPPKTAEPDIDNWSEKEISTKINVIREIWSQRFGAEHVRVFDGDKVANITAKKKPARKESSNYAKNKQELTRMFRYNNTVSIRYNAYDHEYRSNVTRERPENLVQELETVPDEYGIIVCSGKDRFLALKKGCACARIMFALDLVPHDMKKLVCVHNVNANAKRANILSEMNVSIVYDENNKTGADCIISNEAFGISSYDRVKYLGQSTPLFEQYEVTKVRKIMKQRVKEAVPRNVRGYSTNLLDSFSCEKLNKMVSMFTFEHEELELQDDIPDIEKWRESLLDLYMDDDEVLNDALTSSKEMELSIMNFHEAMNIWYTAFINAGISMHIEMLNDNTLSAYHDIGKVLGIDAMIGMYYDGMPTADIVHEKKNVSN